jgi:hypothetical protein
MIGVFGWFDTYAPSATYVLWYVLLGGLALAAAIRSWWRGVVLAFFAIAIVVLPAIIETSHAHTFGYTWSGRDLLPFAVGLPILAASSLRGGEGGRTSVSGARLRLVTTTVIVFAALAQFAAFYEALRRYAVGTTGPIFGFLRHPIWHPAIGILGALALGAVALVAVSWTYWLALREHPLGEADDALVATGPE